MECHLIAELNLVQYSDHHLNTEQVNTCYWNVSIIQMWTTQIPTVFKFEWSVKILSPALNTKTFRVKITIWVKFCNIKLYYDEIERNYFQARFWR